MVGIAIVAAGQWFGWFGTSNGPSISRRETAIFEDLVRDLPTHA